MINVWSVRKSCPRQTRESARKARWYNSDCLQPELPAGGLQLFMKHFRTSQQNNKTEIMLDNENQMRRIYFFSDFFSLHKVFLRWIYLKKKRNNNIINNNNNNNKQEDFGSRNSDWHFSVKNSKGIHAIMGLCCEFIAKVENSRACFFTSHFGPRVQSMRLINNVSINRIHVGTFQLWMQTHTQRRLKIAIACRLILA